MSGNGERRQIRLCDFHPLWRLGIGLLVICLVGGYVVSGMYLKAHYENRDERPGLTFTDIEGAYAGVTVPSPMLKSLREGHPEDVAPADRKALEDWLTGGRVREDYENFDLGDVMPSDIIAAACMNCHARGATGPDADPGLPLEYPDDVFAQAQSREILPKDPAVVIQSLHAHAPSMATVTIVIALLAGLTRWPRAAVGLMVALAGVGLLGDLGGQWLARSTGSSLWVWVVVVGGFASSLGVALMGVMVLVDLWLPGTKKDAAA